MCVCVCESGVCMCVHAYQCVEEALVHIPLPSSERGERERKREKERQRGKERERGGGKPWPERERD